MKQSRVVDSTVVLAATFVIAIASPVPSLAQSVPGFEQSYDRFNDFTSLDLNLGQVIKGSDHKVELSLSQTYRGEGRKARAGSIRLRFVNHSEDGWVYLNYHLITLLVDGERMRFEPEHDGTVGKGYVLEFMGVSPSESQSRQLLGASKIEGKLGIREFKLNPDQVAAIKEFATLVASPDRPVPLGPFVAPPPPPKPKSREEIARDQEAERREEAQRREEARLQGEESRRQEEEDRRRLLVQLNNKLDQKLRLGKAMEKHNTKAAIQYYKEAVDLAPKSPQAKSSTERIKALLKKK